MTTEEFEAEQKELLAYANKTPLVLSLLYDIDMMPEQILATEPLKEKSREWLKMLQIVQTIRHAAKESL
jgi:hypothetical protein